MIISLIGYRGTGKTTVGQLLANQLGLSFFDSDKFVTENSGRTIAEIFASDGETTFRDLESEAVAHLMKNKRAVIAWGGGVILRPGNRDAIGASHKTVWLKADPETILQRIENDQLSNQTRPSLTDLSPLDEIKFQLDKRNSLYRSCSDFSVDTNHMDSATIVARIVEKLDK